MDIQRHLTKEDIHKWIEDTFIFCILPTAIVFLTSLQSGDLNSALMASKVAVIASALNLLKKYASGINVDKISASELEKLLVIAKEEEQKKSVITEIKGAAEKQEEDIKPIEGESLNEKS